MIRYALATAAMVVLFAGCAAAARPPATPATAGEHACTVAYVTDGDTIECEEGSERVRLLMIDAPEMAQGDYGEQATALLEKLLPVGTAARLVTDADERDRYGRLLAYVYAPDGTLVNETLVARGYAVTLVYPPNVRHAERIRAAEAEARAAGAGCGRIGRSRAGRPTTVTANANETDAVTLEALR